MTPNSTPPVFWILYTALAILALMCIGYVVATLISGN